MTYPLTFPDDDPRFTGELIDEIAGVLTRHGYEPVDDNARAGLRAALVGFLYRPTFNSSDKVTWVTDGDVWFGRVEYVTNTEHGPVARILADPQPGGRYRFTTVVACRKLTLVSDGA